MSPRIVLLMSDELAREMHAWAHSPEVVDLLEVAKRFTVPPKA